MLSRLANRELIPDAHSMTFKLGNHFRLLYKEEKESDYNKSRKNTHRWTTYIRFENRKFD